MSKTEFGVEQMDSYNGDPGFSEKPEVSDTTSEHHNNELSTGGDGLQRNLQARHLTMISLGGTIGTGLFLASGSSISTAGPGYSLIAYSLIGTMVYCFMSSLGEMTTYLPITGSINAYGTRFVDPAFGFLLGKLLGTRALGLMIFRPFSGSLCCLRCFLFLLCLANPQLGSWF
jgi:lysine-specific permease